MKNKVGIFMLSSMLLMVAACTTDEESPSDNEMPPQETPQTPGYGSENEEENTNEVAAEIEDIIEIEGMEEPITLELYDKEGTPFLTYVPSDLLAEEASSGEGDAHWFYANYNDEKLEDIYLQIYLFSENVAEQPSGGDEDTTYSILVNQLEVVEEDQKLYDWAIEEYTSADGSKHVMLGEHDNQYFFMEMNSSPEYSAGFVPRANKVIEHFYWKETNGYLTK